MQIINTISEIRDIINNVRTKKQKIVLVPTMGNLHQGHINLVEKSRTYGDFVVVSIFVNPLQFLPNEDFNTYPRTLESDCSKLEGLSDLVFAPSVAQMYPQIKNENINIKAGQFNIQPPPAIADILEGEFRPGFFVGVATVVLKLFNIITPDSAIFGKKDYQQLRVIENMVNNLNLPINIISNETTRENDGLAMSSRNSYLSDAQRQTAVMLSQTLKLGAGQIGKLSFSEIENNTIDTLKKNGWSVDYISIRKQDNLQPPKSSDKNLVILGAAKIGKTRLIDNLEINL